MSWPLVKLGSLCKIVRGSSPRPKGDPRFYGGTVPRLMVGDLTRDGKVVTPKIDFLTEEGAAKSRPMKSGDFIVAVSGQPGQPCILAIDACIHDGFAGLRDLDISRVDKDYLYQFMLHTKQKLSSSAVGAIFKNLTTDQLRELQIPLPPLEEQKRIAAILDKADAIRQKRKQAIELADEFLRSVFLDMFGDPVTNPKGWEERKLITGLYKVQSGWSAKGESFPCASNELGVLKVSAVTSGYFKEYENKFVSREIVPEGKSLLFPRKGDLLFSRANTRELVAATCIVTRDYDNVFLPDKLWKVEPNEDLIPEFLHMLIQQPRFKERLTSQATGSSGSMLNISKAKFEQTMSIFPSIEKQMKFKEIYWKVMRSLTSLEISDAKADDFFGSLSQKAFSGQL
ncbi:restriction endonuclease subunit S [Photobacterium leiognathi]|uniref:restriction endonuclease subunit S n=1 Tax=Photobacterium leiognathi TaxID=553611 RepID=UPI002981FE7B|nr:restriction endonuclease subunit S [Photobacterium leiognathi]